MGFGCVTPTALPYRASHGAARATTQPRSTLFFLYTLVSFLDAVHTQTPLSFLTAPPGRSWCRARDYAATLRSRALSYFLERFFLSRLASRRHTHPNPTALPYRAPHGAARATTCRLLPIQGARMRAARASPATRGSARTASSIPRSDATARSDATTCRRCPLHLFPRLLLCGHKAPATAARDARRVLVFLAVRLV